MTTETEYGGNELLQIKRALIMMAENAERTASALQALGGHVETLLGLARRLESRVAQFESRIAQLETDVKRVRRLTVV